ncbi:MAG: S-layer homology domain-containing protein [Oscillibacter sp.]|nr:S-layer homology domain-containing protein [Oscillibacter sp.]
MPANNGLITYTSTTGATLSIQAVAGLTQGGTVNITATIDGKTSATFTVTVTVASSVTATLNATTPTNSNVAGTKVSTVSLQVNSGAANRVVFSCPTSGVSFNPSTATISSAGAASTTVSYAGSGKITVTANLYNDPVGGSASTTPVLTKTVDITFSNDIVGITFSNYNYSGFNAATNTFTGYGSTATATATVVGYAGQTLYYRWTKSDSYTTYGTDSVIGLTTNSATFANANVAYLTAYNNGWSDITVSVYTDAQMTEAHRIGSKTVRVYVGDSSNYLASVNVTNSYSYALGNRDDANGSSIVDQLAGRYYSGGYYTASSVQFIGSTTHTYGSLNASVNTVYSLTSTASNYLGNVVFTPSGTAGRAIFSVRVNFSNNVPSVDGTICFDTTGATVTSGDINYSGALGDTVYFDASDFADFYYSKTSGGSLNYVTFSTVSSGTGTLYCNGSRLSSAAYYSATSTQNALDGVYFTPSGTTASKGGTVRIGFTASGTRYGYGYNGTISGTVVINYLNGAAKDITYTPTGSSINLSASDFTAAYREVMGSTAPSDLTIQFQDVPDNGTLTYKSSSTATPVTLRATNVKSYRFSTNGSSSNQIANVTYTVSGTRSDTVEYIAYTGGVARFTGKVIFNPSSVSTSVIVTLTCPSSTGGAFNLAEFTKANAVVMANTFQVRFLMPTRGTLTYGGMTATAAGLTVPVNMINSVFYKPNAGMNGIDTVGFVCLDASGNQVGTGQVNVVVSGNTGTSTNTGVTSISQFTDVPANAWYATVLADLVSRGIVQGTGTGKAEPRGTLNYGQALKMILLAAGYPAQAELNSGTQWAANYKSLAVSNGLIDSSVDLTAPISRDAVVELIAKALKVSPVSGNSPFKDSNNPYAIALNRTNPAIIIGNEDGTFNGSSTLLRQEVWAIVYRMNQYTSTQYSTQVPDGI